MTHTPKLVPLPWHPAALALLDEVRAGHERAWIVGPKGVGKSYLLKARALATATEPRRLVYTSVGAVRSGTGVLCTVLDAIHGVQPTVNSLLGSVSDRARRRGATYLLQLCADELHLRNVGAVLVDEAPQLATPALIHVTQLVDHCRDRHQHPLGLAFVSTTTELAALQASGELGQRLSTLLPIPPLAPGDVEWVIAQLSPAVSRVLGKARGRRAEAVLLRLIEEVDGRVRPLNDIVQRAERLARAEGRAVTLADVELAIAMQAGR